MRTGLSSRALSVREQVGDWTYELTFDLSEPVPRPVRLEITPLGTSAAPILTAEVVRQAPLRRLRERAEDLLPSATGQGDEWRQLIPARMASEADYAALAQLYVQVRNEGHPHPIARLSRALAISPNTLNARIARLRELGLIEESRAKSRPRLSRRAQRLLREDSHG